MASKVSEMLHDLMRPEKGTGNARALTLGKAGANWLDLAMASMGKAAHTFKDDFVAKAADTPEGRNIVAGAKNAEIQKYLRQPLTWVVLAFLGFVFWRAFAPRS